MSIEAIEFPEDVFICTELTPWKPGLTLPGTKIVHPEAEALPRRWLTWGRFEQQMRCTACGATWVKA